MKRIICSILVFFILLSFVNAESYTWQSINLDEDAQTVSHHTFIYFDDTSSTLLGKSKPIKTTIAYTIQDLPYNLIGYNGTIDWCNVSIEVLKNIYDSDGNLINTTTEEESYYYNSNNVTTEYIIKNLYAKDVLFADAKCHYTNPDTLYVEGFLAGEITLYMPSFECNHCEEYSLEELSNEIERSEATLESQQSIYSMTQSIIDLNFTIWLIFIWIIKIGLLLVAISLIFYSAYFLYMVLKGIHQRI